jgi:hypothetical protein
MTRVEAGQQALRAVIEANSPLARRPHISRREIVTLLAYLESGSHKGAAWKLGISESASRQRMSQLMRRIGARNVAQAVWVLRTELEARPIGLLGVEADER